MYCNMHSYIIFKFLDINCAFLLKISVKNRAMVNPTRARVYIHIYIGHIHIYIHIYIYIYIYIYKLDYPIQ